MTCASCVKRIEKELNSLDGVSATVNLATARATVSCDGSIPERLVAAVAVAGHRARPVAARAREARHRDPDRELRRRLALAVATSRSSCSR